MSEMAASVSDPLLRAQLLDRREQLAAAASTSPIPEVQRLLKQVDEALTRMDHGTYGLCQTCHEGIEPERLAANPLTCFCLEHLDAAQRRAFEADVESAVRIQAGLLPSRNFSLGEWEACYEYEPLGPVSGDFCDLQAAEDGRMFFLVGDIAGKGVSASLLMSHLHAILRSLLSMGMPLSELLQRANRLFCEVARPPYYATLVCGFAGGSGEVEICNAGHCPPVVLHAGENAFVPATGVPLGLFCDAQYHVARLQLEHGDLMVLYTDGISEARDRAGQEYGAERIAEFVRRLRGLTAAEIATACHGDIRRFLGGAARADDLTIMAVRRRTLA